MQENPSAAGRPVGYSLNVFPYETLAGLWTCLNTEVLQIKDQAYPREVFPIELRFSERLVRELQQDCAQVARLKYFLETHDLALVTINGFVMPHFHGERVKERVYLPAWHESDARLKFTQACIDLLAQLAPITWEGGAPSPLLSVSVPFGALKPVSLAAIAPNILKAGEHAALSHERTGIHCVVALEPEPGLCVETTAEAIEFFDQFVPARLRRYLTVNFDLSHQLVEFEDIGGSIKRLQQQAIVISKVHIANAAELTTLKAFYADSIYLHQVCGIDANGQRAYFSLDWPTAPPPSTIQRFRCHYHLPVFPNPEGAVNTTLAEVEAFLEKPSPLPSTVPYIIETYTWPEQLGGRNRLVENICQEIFWVRQRIHLSYP